MPLSSEAKADNYSPVDKD